MCRPEDFEYKQQRIEEEEKRNLAPRSESLLGEVHHGGPQAKGGKENKQKSKTSGGEQEKMLTQEDPQAPGRPPPKGL